MRRRQGEWQFGGRERPAEAWNGDIREKRRMAKRRKARGGSSGANRAAQATGERHSASSAHGRSSSGQSPKSGSRRRSPLERAEALIEKAYSARSFERQ